MPPGKWHVYHTIYEFYFITGSLFYTTLFGCDRCFFCHITNMMDKFDFPWHAAENGIFFAVDRHSFRVS
ncbi:hypothetical protein DESC_680007 [Desulfosarcina cetonica]|nr:hypothetical protein DESC_680007 [Desulfosarcina cetonica]